MGYLVFMSYATRDSSNFQVSMVDEKLKNYPEIDKVLYWEADMHDDIYQYMDDNVRLCDIFLLFCSSHTSKSEPVKMEWRAALKLGKKIIPIFVEDKDIPTLLSTKLGVRFDANDFDGTIENIYKLILKKLKSPTPAAIYKKYYDFFNSIRKKILKENINLSLSEPKYEKSWKIVLKIEGFFILIKFFDENLYKIDLIIDTSNKITNKIIFSKLRQQQNSIERLIGFKLEWNLRPNYKESCISLTRPFSIKEQEKDLNELIQFSVEFITKFNEILLNLSNLINIKKDHKLGDFWIQVLKPETAQAIEELEIEIENSIPLVDKIDVKTFGLVIEGDRITQLGLCRHMLEKLPEPISKMKSIRYISIGIGNRLKELPQWINNLSSLETLELLENELKRLPEEIGKLLILKKLDLSANQIEVLPESIGNLESLEELNLWRNNLKTLPESFGNLKKLRILNLGRNSIESLPFTVGNLRNLEIIYLNNNKLINLPESFGNLKSLQSCNLSNNEIKTLPKNIGNLSSIFVINLKNNKLSSLSDSFGELKTLQRLYLDNNRFEKVPGGLWSLKDLKELTFEGNSLAPKDIAIIKKDLTTILNYAKNFAKINILIYNNKYSESKSEINLLKDFLESQDEVMNVFYYDDKEIEENFKTSLINNLNQIKMILIIVQNKFNFNTEIQDLLNFSERFKLPLVLIRKNEILLDSSLHSNFSLRFDFIYTTLDTETFFQRIYQFIKKIKRKIDLFNDSKRYFDILKYKIELISKNYLNSGSFANLLKNNLNQINDILNNCESEEIDKPRFLHLLFKYIFNHLNEH